MADTPARVIPLEVVSASPAPLETGKIYKLDIDLWSTAHVFNAGHRLAVVTAKNEPHARRIVEHLPFGGCVEAVIGATADGARSHKPELIGEALRRLSLAPARCWMIGDRRMDIEGARQHGMRSIGVLWGFGSADELRTAGADQLVASPDALLAAVR